MHYKTDMVDFPIAPVDDFLKTQDGAQRSKAATLEFTSDTLPKDRSTVVLSRAR